MILAAPLVTLLIAQAVSTAGTPAPAPAAASCDIFVSSAVACRIESWSTLPEVDVSERSALEDLLEELLEGGPQDATAQAACLKKSAIAKSTGCPDLSCIDELADTCTLQLVQAFARLATETSSKPVRLGAVATAFAFFLDEPPDAKLQPAVSKALLDAARSLLAPDRDAITHAAMLKMKGAAELKQAELTDLVAPMMSDPNKLVQLLAVNDFYQTTNCPLMEAWSHENPPSTEQVDAARAWWTARRSNAAPTGSAPK